MKFLLDARRNNNNNNNHTWYVDKNRSQSCFNKMNMASKVTIQIHYSKLMLSNQMHVCLKCFLLELKVHLSYDFIASLFDLISAIAILLMLTCLKNCNPYLKHENVFQQF